MSEELSGELHKLEITPAEVDLPSIKLLDCAQLPLLLNPFYEDAEKPLLEAEVSEGQHTAASVTQQKLRNQMSCRRCRLRRRSESVADDYKEVSQALSTSALTNNSCWTHSTPGVQRQALKSRRVVLRLPVLRKLQNLHKLFQTLPAVEQCEQAAVGNTAAAIAVAAIQKEDITAQQIRGRGICDFRDLINECQSLLELEADVKGRLGLVSPGQRVSKNFTTIQHSTLPSNELQRTGSNTNAENKTNCGALLPINSIMQRNSSSPTPEHNAAAIARATRTSCSQQAGSSVTSGAGGGSGNNCDDVTIDELASYFDTFVHIPKKMSTMAEMMYI